MTANEWTSESSQVYRQLAAVAVPHRAEQIATLLTLMPVNRRESFRVVELASGEGFLSKAILSAFPNVTVLALDGEETMRQTTAKRLRPFGERASVAAFDMTRDDWHERVEGADCVVSSLCVHHLDGQGKRALFKAMHERLSDAGTLLIADLVHPARAQANEVYAAQWDRAAEVQAREHNAQAAYEHFISEHWNHYRYPDPFDKPSRLFEQLVWLKEAGFADVDCYWMAAGHAIYGGYKRSEAGAPFSGISYGEALTIVENVLRDDSSPG